MSLLQNKRKREEFSFGEKYNYLDEINNKDSNIFSNSIFSSIKSDENNNLNNIFQSALINKNISNIDNGVIFPIFQSNLINPLISEKIFQNKRLKVFFTASSFQFDKYINIEAFISNNYNQLPNEFEYNKFDFYDKNKSKVEQQLKQSGENNKKTNFFDILINNKKQTHFSIKKEVKIIKNSLISTSTKINNSPNQILNGQNINSNLFTTKSAQYSSSKKLNEAQNGNVVETSKPFQTYNTKLFAKSSQNSNKQKSGQPKIFHIEKIYNKKEYKDANEKESDEEDKNLKNRFKINLKKIKQIYTNSCLKIYSYLNDKINYSENNLNDELYISNIIQQVYEIIKEKKINSSKMNEILQVNDDDKYRKHYFMFTSEAKQFCLDLINIKKLSFDIVMKMCKVPRKSLRRWSHVGCNRKKGCGRKTRNPEMENKLVEWYKEVVTRNISVSAKMIRDKAVEISEDKEFLASKGWLEKFKKKFNIRIVTHKNKNLKKILCLKEKKNKNKKEHFNNKEREDSLEINDLNEENNDDVSLEEENEINKSENENDNDNEKKDEEEKNYVEENHEIIRNNYKKAKFIKENIFKKPIFLKTKILGKGNNKKFNVFKCSTNC